MDEKTKQEIEIYINSNFEKIKTIKRTSKGKLSNVKKWVHVLAEFAESLDQNLNQIISNNGIKNVDSINELILFARNIYNEKAKDL